MRVDSHHHLWRYRADEYAWISDEMRVLKRDYDVDALENAALASGVDATIAVQARQTLAENDFLLAAAARSPLIAGVVGWVDLRAPDVDETLASYAGRPRFLGVRHIVQAEPDGFLHDPAFNHGISRLQHHRLVYDVLVVGRQMRDTVGFVDRHPNQPFVLDHLGKPTIRRDHFDAGWASDFRELARRQHVTCKLSGMVTEVRDETWSVDLLRPYADLALECFGPERLMMGSDWPVCRMRAEYDVWQDAVGTLVGALSSTEQSAIFGGTAARVYGLGGLGV